MSRDKNVQTKLIRVGQILRVFMEKDKVSTTWLSNQFQTTQRTIQRDLLLLKESGFPLHEIQKGIYQMNKDLVKNLEVFDETELALVIALKNIVGQLGQPFKKAADGVLDRLYDCVTGMPVFVKIDDVVPLDSHLLNWIIRAIRERKQVSFQYAAGKDFRFVILAPYRVACFSGFWYLIGNEISTGILKRYVLDKITSFKLSKTCFKSVPENLDDILQGSANIWFTEDRNLEVTVQIDASCSHYFKRRTMYPTQKIIKEKKDGSIIASFKVGQYEAIQNMIKSWMPHILILKPEGLKESVLKDVKRWIDQQQMMFK